MGKYLIEFLKDFNFKIYNLKNFKYKKILQLDILQ